MLSDDLAPIRQRLYQAANQRTETTPVWPSDLRTFLEAHDRQVTRLAAVEKAVADNQYLHQTHPVERVTDLSPRGRCPSCGYVHHPCDPIGLLEDVEAALKGEYSDAG